MSTTVISSQKRERYPTLSGAARRAAWVQFPRRVLFLLIAFAAALALITYSTDGIAAPAQPLLGPAARSILLLAGALVLATVLGGALTVVAVAVHGVQQRAGWLGALLRALGRVSFFILAPAPVAALAFLLLLAGFSLFGQLPVAGEGSTGARSLIVAALTIIPLSFLPALLSAQAATRTITLSTQQPGWRRWLAGAFTLLGALLMQTGGVLSGLIVVEVIFAQPGLGRLMLMNVGHQTLGAMGPILAIMAVVILLARLAGELCNWIVVFLLARDERPARSEAVESSRRLWTIFALLLLLIPLSLVLLGALTPEAAAVEQDLQNRLLPPSAEHLLGTDDLGRDLWARARLGALNTVGRAVLVAGLLLFPAIVIGMLGGVLSARPSWLWQSASDLLLLPLDVLLFFPLLPTALALLALIGQPESTMALLAVSVLLLARATRAGRSLWVARPADGSLGFGLVVLGAVFLGALFAAFGLIVGLGYMGFGIQPPTPDLGVMLQALQSQLLSAPQGALAVTLLIAAIAFALYTAADALVDFSNSKWPLVHFNE
ncbi:MAG TPA: hypothetical protein VK879_19345 [Candidatus Sulfomarinibacteraceae bacterium]|nr:hypothetical protein [Candidatus Sulfomarinibacteraceae bacterium]